MISIITPVLDEEAVLGAALARLQPLRALGAQVLVADGGSRDASRAIATGLADRVTEAPRGRASQMNAGARLAEGEILLFLHADTILPAGAVEAIESGLERSRRAWGRFDVSISGGDPLLAVVAFMMNLRSRLTGIATGDQAIFVTRSAFEACGGFPEIALMEDLALCRALKRQSRPLCLRERVVTSGRRWEANGVLRTIVLMWWLRLAFALGADPRSLARAYGVPHDHQPPPA